ncbi:phosphate/phosphite/phosphonate ABC transporter substrate-binding protein [Desulfobotulus mexicanus]|uniref:Phosphate/phosphite/phosphonate ABC transporter substrate-binding protein n=1 Tax=Desulfobotulus mexicanus TaxID=2586642 RepID=A0A5Q4VIF8_9BACT|nr:phosphate/phosphite/phosphonate ABC transporter substrate-binding protein [Desulfobotulus mexicanus]TYT76032.1 phosphate/phosphite/phosphonate ABC transporter substrate-binding protein [Desulfobotulus mexicanus]
MRLSLSVAFIFFFVSLSFAAAGTVYRLSMLPLHSPEEVMDRISPLALYLSLRTGEKIIPVVYRDYAEYESKILSGELAIGYQNPSVYIKISDMHEPLFLAEDGIGGSRFRGLVILRSDSPVQSLSDLRGKTIGIVGKTSTGGFLSPRLTLQKAGLEAGRDYRVVEATDNTQENVIFSVHLNEVDAGFIRESALHMADTYLPRGRIRVLAEGEWIPNYCISVNRNLPEKFRMDIRKALAEIRPGDPVFKSLYITGLQPVDDDAFDVIREAAGR